MNIKKITFVCTGNTCRSVMAQQIFKEMIKDTPLKEIEVDSAGTAAMPYYIILGDLKEVMDENRVDYSGHTPKMVDEEILRTADLVLVMTRNHKDIINSRFPEYRSKIFLLSEYAGDKNSDIADPIGKGKSAYREAFKTLKYYLDKVTERLKDEFEGNR